MLNRLARRRALGALLLTLLPGAALLPAALEASARDCVAD